MADSTAAAAVPTFSEIELQQLQSDDLKAGKLIGRTLVIMFLYSAITMGGVMWWTFASVSERSANPPNAANPE